MSGNGVEIRPANPEEMSRWLQGDRGFLAFDHGEKVGQIAINTHQGFFYVHSLSSSGPSEVAAGLVQAVKREARNLGYRQLSFLVEDPVLAKRYLARSRATVIKAWLQIPIQK